MVVIRLLGAGAGFTSQEPATGGTGTKLHGVLVLLCTWYAEADGTV